MDELQTILTKLDNMEKRLDVLEGLKVEQKQCDMQKVFYSPHSMPVGYVAYAGKYVSLDKSMSSTFGADSFEIAKVMECNSFEMAKVIDAFSSEDRINIVKELMQRQMTAKQLMDKLNFQTTGKLYHHLSFLEKIGIIRKSNDHYYVAASYISCIILIAMGVERIIRKNNNEN